MPGSAGQAKGAGDWLELGRGDSSEAWHGGGVSISSFPLSRSHHQVSDWSVVRWLGGSGPMRSDVCCCHCGCSSLNSVTEQYRENCSQVADHRSDRNSAPSIESNTRPPLLDR